MSELGDRINKLNRVRWSGTAFRHTAPGRTPLSGVGAALNGGRWNSRGTATIYLGVPREVVVAEFHRMANRAGAAPSDFLPRDLHTVTVLDAAILDLTDADTRASVGLTLEAIADADWDPCQAIGEAAREHGFQGILSPSATGVGAVLAIFEDATTIAQLTVVSTERLDTMDDDLSNGE